MPSVTIRNPINTTPTIKEKRSRYDDIRISLQKILAAEYGDRYTAPDRTVETAQQMMQVVNPHLAARTPDEALDAFKTQFKAYSAGSPPFDRKRRLRESPRSWWEQLLTHEGADVLAVKCSTHSLLSKILTFYTMQAIAVKMFSLMPTSMVDERAMSVVTWLNSPKRNRQGVATVFNHLAIRNFMDFQNTVIKYLYN